VRSTRGIDQHQFAIEDGRLHGQLGEGLDQADQPVGVFDGECGGTGKVPAFRRQESLKRMKERGL
jgi:hypothetical protein